MQGKKALANATIIPLRLPGLVNTRSVVNLGGSGPHKGSLKTLRTRGGNLA